MQTPAAAAPSPSDAAEGGGSGCCAVTLLVYKGTGLVAWLGDARCVLARKEKAKEDAAVSLAANNVSSAPKVADKLNAFALTKDHKAILLKEKQRIEKVRLQSVCSRRLIMQQLPVELPLFIRFRADCGVT
jgi:serine/threonine protein phosphatase PrpC